MTRSFWWGSGTSSLCDRRRKARRLCLPRESHTLGDSLFSGLLISDPHETLSTEPGICLWNGLSNILFKMIVSWVIIWMAIPRQCCSPVSPRPLPTSRVRPSQLTIPGHMNEPIEMPRQACSKVALLKQQLPTSANLGTNGN